MLVTPAGILREVIPVPASAHSAMVVRVGGSVIALSLLLMKAWAGSEVMPAKITTARISVLFWNAGPAISVTVHPASVEGMVSVAGGVPVYPVIVALLPERV